MSPAELYVEGIREKLEDYYAAWLPSTRLNLGDVGTLDGDFFHYRTSLANLGIAFEPEPDTDPSPIEYMSSSGVSFNIKFAGETSAELPKVPQAKAGIGFSFSREGAFVLMAPESYEPYIRNMDAVEEQIRERYKRGEWNKDWVVIVKIVIAPTASIIIARNSSSELQLAASADLDNGIVDFGKAEIGFQVRSQSGDLLKMIGAKNVSPVFQLAQFKGSGLLGLGENVFGTRAFGPGRLDVPFTDVTPALAASDPNLARALRLELVRPSRAARSNGAHQMPRGMGSNVQ